MAGVSTLGSPSPSKRATAPSPLGDYLFRGCCQGAGLFVLAVAGSLLAVLTIQAWPFLNRPDSYRLFISTDWNPDRGQFGAVVFIYGTLATSLIAMLIGVPLGVGAAAYLSEIAHGWVRRTCSFLLELLAAVPSVIYGFWALEFLAKDFTRPLFDLLQLENKAGGQGILAAGIVLAVMILPYITAVSYDVCQAVPRSQREGALAVGATRWQTIWHVVLPYARPGILAGAFLALGRAIGETMAVTMVIGNAKQLQFSLSATGDAIPSAIAKQMPEATGSDHRAALITLGLILLLITLVTNLLARWIIGRLSKPRLISDRGSAHEIVETTPVPAPSPEALARARNYALRVDRFMTWVLGGCQLLTVIPLFLILGYITSRGLPGLNLDLFLKTPLDSDGRGLGHAMLGSLILVGMASVFAVPVGLFAAILLSEYRNTRLATPVRFVAEQLSGVPSIVIGVYAYSVLVFPLWADRTWGYSAWAGAFALGVLMLPVVIRAGEEAMRLVPLGLREASYALGATRRQTTLRVVIPSALPAIITGVLLAVGRITGETAPLLLTARGSNYWTRSVADLNGPTPSLPYFVYTLSTNPGEADVQLAWSGAFVLIVVVLFLNVGTRLLAGNRLVAAARAD